LDSAQPDVEDEVDESAVLRATRASLYERLVALLKDPRTRVRLSTYLYLSDMGVSLIKECEGNPNALPHDWAARTEFWRRNILEEAHRDTEQYLDAVIDEIGSPLTEDHYNDVSTPPPHTSILHRLIFWCSR
jgi:hypothetical protein